MRDARSMQASEHGSERVASRFAEQVVAREPFEAADTSARLRAIHQKLALTLRPVVGEHGFDAMFAASVRTTRSLHPALGQAAVAATETWLEPFWSAVRDADPPLAMAIELTLFTTFFELVADFIGPLLALQLFRQTWPSVVIPDATEREHDEPR